MANATIDKPRTPGSGSEGGTFRAISSGESPEDYLWQAAQEAAGNAQISPEAITPLRKTIEFGVKRLTTKNELDEVSLSKAATTIRLFVRSAKENSAGLNVISLLALKRVASDIARGRNESIPNVAMFYPFWPPFWWPTEA